MVFRFSPYKTTRVRLQASTAGTGRLLPRSRTARYFLPGRLLEIEKDYDFIHVEDDVQTNAAFLHSSRVELYTSKDTPKSAVFSINNGEEDSFYGAQACAVFMHSPSIPKIHVLHEQIRTTHTWVNSTSMLLKFEGAAPPQPEVPAGSFHDCPACHSSTAILVDLSSSD